MSTTLYQRFDGGSQLVLTRCANAAGKGTRLELYAAAGDRGQNPICIQDPVEAASLGIALDQWAHQETLHRMTGGGPPPEQTIDFVAWKLRIQSGFFRRILELVPHADPTNRRRLHDSFPFIVEAWEAWQEADGDFELPPSSRRFLERQS